MTHQPFFRCATASREKQVLLQMLALPLVPIRTFGPLSAEMEKPFSGINVCVNVHKSKSTYVNTDMCSCPEALND